MAEWSIRMTNAELFGAPHPFVECFETFLRSLFVGIPLSMPHLPDNGRGYFMTMSVVLLWILPMQLHQL
jgi:hypothetical protein